MVCVLRENAEGQVNLNLTVDKAKMKADTERAEKKVQDLGQKVTDSIRGGRGEK
jgi:hypothetical protein